MNGQPLLTWLRHRPMALMAHGWLLVHAGVVPQWDADKTLTLAAEIEALLRGPGLVAVCAMLLVAEFIQRGLTA